jgi:hypothetical protein
MKRIASIENCIENVNFHLKSLSYLINANIGFVIISEKAVRAH